EPRYPLVHPAPPRGGHALVRRPNVLLLFVEALDRRHLRRTVNGVRVTPFLDGFFEDSVSFEGFHSNGAQTFHGLFATLCSALPRHGVAATKARHANDYLCLPSLLKRAGYRTQMVIGQNRDRNHSRHGRAGAGRSWPSRVDRRRPARAARCRPLPLAAGDLVASLAAHGGWLSSTRGAGAGEPGGPHADHPGAGRADTARVAVRRAGP